MLNECRVRFSASLPFFTVICMSSIWAPVIPFFFINLYLSSLFIQHEFISKIMKITLSCCFSWVWASEGVRSAGNSIDSSGANDDLWCIVSSRHDTDVAPSVIIELKWKCVLLLLLFLLLLLLFGLQAFRFSFSVQIEDFMRSTFVFPITQLPLLYVDFPLFFRAIFANTTDVFYCFLALKRSLCGLCDAHAYLYA